MQGKKSILVVNKADVMSKQQRKQVLKAFAKHEVIVLSAATHHNLNDLVERLVLG